MIAFEFLPITIETASDISSWKYNGETLYMDPYFVPRDNDIIKGPANCDGYAVFLDKRLIGLFEFYFDESNQMEIGIAIHPDYVGQHLSKGMIHQGIRFGMLRYDYLNPFVYLRVDPQNLSAYHAYLSAGFKEYERVDNEIKMRISVKDIL